MLRRVIVLLLLSLLPALAGCSGEKDKGKNKNRDRPTSGASDE